MARYSIKQRIADKGWVIWDSTLNLFLGDGKGNVAQFETHVRAQDVVDIMVERVGA